ncbi:hypothetical protein QPK87_30040 [Kamptonema cortianum]|nr:hypothetical protein [Kamptonema cortianum]
MSVLRRYFSNTALACELARFAVIFKLLVGRSEIVRVNRRHWKKKIFGVWLQIGLNTVVTSPQNVLANVTRLIIRLTKSSLSSSLRGLCLVSIYLLLLLAHVISGHLANIQRATSIAKHVPIRWQGLLSASIVTRQQKD